MGLNVRNRLPVVEAGPRAEPRGYTGRNPAEPGWRSEAGAPGGSTDATGLVQRDTFWPPTSVLQQTGCDVDPWSLLQPILAWMSELWRTWAAGDLKALQAAWSARDVSRGCRVRLAPDGPEGVAAGIDATGALHVRLPDGRETLARAGELAFLDGERRGV
jgi:hypothetical protein